MRIIVIGASAAGLKAASRARRLMPDVKVTVLEEGKFISYAACGLPYYLSGDIEDFRPLTTTIYNVEKTPEFFAAAKDIEVLTGIRSESIDSGNKIVRCRNLESKKAVDFEYDALVLAVGKTPILPDIKGLNSPGVYTFIKPQDAMELREAAENRKIDKVAVIGAGFIGCELCEAFSALWGIETVLIEPENQILPGMLDFETARIVELELQRQDIEVHLNTKVNAITSKFGKLSLDCEGIKLHDFDRVVITTGVNPRTELAQTAGIAIGALGGIKVDERMRTNIEGIYAAGDCVEVRHEISGEYCFMPLGSLANRMGRVAGNNIAGREDAFAPIVGAACLKVFDMNIASVGLTQQAAENAGFKTAASWGLFNDKAHYYPESKLISVKMVFDRATKRILGVQAVGKGGAVRRIDAASVMISQGMSLKQVMDFEQAYAPPYAEVLDPLHYLAFAGISYLDEGIEPFPPHYFEENVKGTVAIDLREPIEVKEKPVKIPADKVLEIPFTQLRSRINEIPKGVKISALCPRGTRSSEAVVILKEYGFNDVKYMGGGLAFFQNY